MTALLSRICALAALIARTLASLWRFALAILRARFGGRSGKRKLRPWMHVREARETRAADLAVTDSDAQRLLDRMKRLNDVSRLTTRAVGFAGSGADYFADPREVESIVEALVLANPPFLHIAREQPAQGEGDAREYETEYLLREEDVLVTERETLFIPQVGVEYLESRRPPGYPVLRAAKSLSDLRSATLLYQELPEDLLVARLLDGSIPLLAYREERHNLLFRPEERWIQHRERRENRVPIEIETGGAASGERLVYLLFDRSTSLVHNCTPRGINAVMEIALAVTMLRADMGRPHAKYLFRAFADRLDPLAKDPPLTASSVAEKDWLVGRIFATNFSGEATHVVEALTAAMDDIEHLQEHDGTGLDPARRPRIGLLTDGRSSLYGGVGVRLKRLGIELDTVLIGRDAAHNPDLLRISSTVSYVDPALYRAAPNALAA